jgi:hypothetical protein
MQFSTVTNFNQFSESKSSNVLKHRKSTATAGTKKTEIATTENLFITTKEISERVLSPKSPTDLSSTLPSPPLPSFS